MHLVTDLLGSSLYHSVIKPKRVLPAADLQGITKNILTALVSLKEFGVVHCDVKPENILFANCAAEGVRLIDFGSASLANDLDLNYVQTRPYRAPEVVLDCRFDFQADMWSLGCVIYELVTFKLLFPYKHVQENISKAMALSKFFNLESMASRFRHQKQSFVEGSVVTIERGEEVKIVLPKNDFDFTAELMSANCNSLLIDFARRCLIFDPRERMTAEEGLQHEFIQKKFD